jgi:hypothetical protein
MEWVMKGAWPIGKMSRERATLRGTIFITGEKWNSKTRTLLFIILDNM